jgi:hypothetical protein
MVECEHKQCIKYKYCATGSFHIKPSFCKLRKEYLTTIVFFRNTPKIQEGKKK